MAYALPFRDRDGRHRELTGRKDVWRQPGIGLWAATTTLRTSMSAAGEPTSDRLAGTLRLSPLGVLAGALSFRAVRPASRRHAAGQVLRMLWFFGDGIAQQFVPGWPRRRS